MIRKTEPRWYWHHHRDHTGWRHRGTWLYGPRTEAHAEWRLFAKKGHGYGFQFGRNGSESDIGLDLYAGPLGSLWARLRSPWTRWARISQERDPENWYHARHYGVTLFPWNGCIIQAEFGALEGRSSRGDPWYRDMTLTTRMILGNQTTTTETVEMGLTNVPMPEGNYAASWEKKRRTWRYKRWPGRLIDIVRGPRVRDYVTLDIAGGIPFEGKGENSWDCGMDGLFGCGGRTVEDAVGHAVSSVLRSRERYGGPHNLTQPTSVRELDAS